MSWIALTNGATSGEVPLIREGELTDIASADRANWRVVNNDRPLVDGLTEQFVRIGLPIASDGTVTAEWSIVSEPAAVIKLRLSELADREALARIAKGRVTRSGKQVGIDDASLMMLQNGKATIDAGIATTVTMQTADDDLVDVGIAPLTAVIVDVVTARQAIFAARKTIVTAILAGTLTTSVSVSGHAAWPA